MNLPLDVREGDVRHNTHVIGPLCAEFRISKQTVYPNDGKRLDARTAHDRIVIYITDTEKKVKSFFLNPSAQTCLKQGSLETCQRR
jgi:hypothetical protein